MSGTSSQGAMKAAAALAMERPRHECLFPQLRQTESPTTPLPVVARELSRCSRSEPLLASSFRKAVSSKGRASAGNWNSPPSGTASGLSAATTAFVVASTVGSKSDAPIGSRVLASNFVLANTQEDSLDEAVVEAASNVSREAQKNGLQAFLPYRASPASSLVSGWRAQYSKDVGKSTALARGLRGQDLRFCTANSPGVCVLRQQDDVPKIPGINSAAIMTKQGIIDSVAKQLLQMGVAPPIPVRASSIGGSEVVGANGNSERRLDNREVRAPSMSSSHGRESEVGSVSRRRKNLPAEVARDRY